RVSESVRGLTVGANLTLVLSEVELTEEQRARATNATRPLSGQSPWVVNASVGYAPPDSPFSAFVFYNVYGPSVFEVGTNGLPDSYQQPFHSLDVSGRWAVSDHLELKLVIKNLLNDNFLVQQGTFNLRDYRPGVSGSLGLSLTL
ncbi:MAG: TonB-dependent receptor, partial [Planctomycetes bacterium]|nr:TonB-dependent receptor [Planctomycetota bacterium]